MNLVMKLLAVGALAVSSGSAIAQTAPAEKKDGGSLSSGAKDAMPATKNQGENTGASGGTSTGASGSTEVGKSPSEKKDGGSLSSGAKDAMPATSGSGENKVK